MVDASVSIPGKKERPVCSTGATSFQKEKIIDAYSHSNLMTLQLSLRGHEKGPAITPTKVGNRVPTFGSGNSS